jgi:hypothetical protein
MVISSLLELLAEPADVLQIKGSDDAFGRQHSHPNLSFCGGWPSKRWPARLRGTAPRARCGMLINIALWLIAVGLLAIIPAGCIMTRRPKKPPAPAE